MNLISDILFWISNGLLVPVVVLLIILFIRSTSQEVCLPIRAKYL